MSLKQSERTYHGIELLLALWFRWRLCGGFRCAFILFRRWRGEFELATVGVKVPEDIFVTLETDVLEEQFQPFELVLDIHDMTARGQRRKDAARETGMQKDMVRICECIQFDEKMF